MSRDLNALVATAAAQVDTDTGLALGEAIHALESWIDAAPPLRQPEMARQVAQLFTQLATADRPMLLSEFIGQVQPAALPAATPNPDELRLIGLGREVENDAEIAALVRRLLTDGTGAVGRIDPSTGQLGIEQELADERSEVANLQKLVEDMMRAFEQLGVTNADSLVIADLVKSVREKARQGFAPQVDLDALEAERDAEKARADALEAERDRLQADFDAAKAAAKSRFFGRSRSGDPA